MGDMCEIFEPTDSPKSTTIAEVQMRMRWTRRRRGAARARMVTSSLAAVALSAGFVAGCGTSSGPGGSKSLSGQTLTVYTQAPTGSGAAEYKAHYDYIAKLFHQQTGSSVTWDYFSSGTQLSQTVESSVATHSGPDIFSVGSSYNGTVAGAHAFHVFTSADWAETGGRSSFVPRMLTMSGPSASQDIGFVNEPEIGPSYASMFMTPAQAADFVPYLGRALQRDHLSTKVACCDAEGWTDCAAYTRAVLGSPAAARYVGLITSHGYTAPHTGR